MNDHAYTRRWLQSLGVLAGGELFTDIELDDLAAGVLAPFPPGWRPWCGVTGIIYAREAKSSPPRIVRAETLDQAAARAHEWNRGERDHFTRD